MRRYCKSAAVERLSKEMKATFCSCNFIRIVNGTEILNGFAGLTFVWSCLQHYAQCELLPRDSACSPDVSIARQFRQHVESSSAVASP